MTLRLGRVYDDVALGDGQRVLVDRLWPRGVHSGDPRAGRWCKEVAPSTELRKWYDHQPERYAVFAERYRAELAEPAAAGPLAEVRALIDAGPVMLVTATKTIEQSHLPVLADVLQGR